MSEKQLNAGDTISESVILRHIFFESLASSPTIVSSSSPNTLLSSPSDSNDVSIGTCIKYIRSRVSQALSKDILDKLENQLKDDAPNGRISWKMFKPIAQNWISSININDNKYQDGNNNLNKSTDDDTTSNPDGGTVESTPDISDDSSKSNELVEWSIISKNRTDNDTTNEYENTSVQIKSPEQADSVTEVELRVRVRRLNEDNAWLRDELERTEELAAGYQKKFYSLRQRLEQISEKRIQLERENEAQKEMIIKMEEEERRYLIALEKAEKERKLYGDKLEINRQMIAKFNGKIEKLKNDKKNILNQLTTCRKKLSEKELMCDMLQDKNDELTEQNANLEEYYEKTVRNLQERSDDLKNENFQLYSRISSGHPSMELNMSSSMIHLNNSLESLPNDENKVPFKNSLYEELKASGFSFEETQSNMKIQQLKEKLDWYNDEIFNAIEKLDTIMKQLGREPESEDKKRLSDASESQTRYILILLDKITLISDAVKEIIEKPSTNDMGVQVSADPHKDRGLREFNILTFGDSLNTPIIRRDPASGDSFNVYFTIGPALIAKPDLETLPKSIYTSTEKLNRRRWGRKFNSIAVGTPSGDAPINSNSSLSPHSSAQLETKIILRSAMNIGDNNSRVNDAISPKSHKEINIGENSYCESFSECLSLSPIGDPRNMSEKIVPKRKKSVYVRTYEIEKAFNTPHAMTERITSSTPSPDDHSDTSTQPIFALSEYRTRRNCSESSDSFSIPKLHTSIEEDTSNSDISGFNEQSVCIAPPKLNLGIENEMKNLNITYPIQQDSMCPVSTNNSVVKIGKSNIEILTHTNNDRDEILDSSPLSCIDNINNNFNRDLNTKNSSKPIDVTQIVQLNVNSTSQRVSDDRDERAARKKRAVESVTLAMSTGDDSSDLSDSDGTANCNTTSGNESNDKQASVEDKCVILGAIQSNADDSIHAVSISFENNLPTSTTDFNNEVFTSKHEIVPAMKRSRSESECLGGYGREGHRCICTIQTPKKNSNSGEYQLMVFPSLPDIRLKKAGIANFSDNDDLEANNLAEDDLARKFTAFSLGLCSDRVTLLRRKALCIRQRDQTEHNFIGEISKMQQTIQDLAPLCFDSETIERIERARNQIDIIAQCAHKISCTAETLGAIQQEYRISRAVNFADRYLRILRSKCEKLVIDLAETKRILMEHNIIIDENTGECSEELTTLRYRGLPANNRTMTAKRRASIATIFRPIVTGQDTVKDGIRQRNSVSGRVTLRRPSFSTDFQRWESEKLNRTESSNSIGELHEIFEQAESRRTSREENNNIMRFPVNVCEREETDLKELEKYVGEEIEVGVATSQDSQPASRRISRLILGPGNYVISWRLMLWCIIISFFIGFYVKHAVSSVSCIGTPFKWWSIEEIIDQHLKVRNTAQRPI